MKRQHFRKTLIFTCFLLFPITMWYFSPYIIISAAMKHIFNGSCIVFAVLFILGIFFGRLFCAYLCPTGGMQECLLTYRNKKTSGKGYFSKYIIFGLWISTIIACHILGSGNYTVNFTYMTDHGISIYCIGCYIIYYGVMLLFFLPALLFGKRFGCHYFCWISPFMIIGNKLGKLLHIPSLKIRADKNKCISCGKCSKECPMSIDIKKEIKCGGIKSAECINCANCIDVCPENVLHYSFDNKSFIKVDENCKVKTKIHS